MQDIKWLYKDELLQGEYTELTQKELEEKKSNSQIYNWLWNFKVYEFNHLLETFKKTKGKLISPYVLIVPRYETDQITNEAGESSRQFTVNSLSRGIGTVSTLVSIAGLVYHLADRYLSDSIKALPLPQSAYNLGGNLKKPGSGAVISYGQNRLYPDIVQDSIVQYHNTAGVSLPTILHTIFAIGVGEYDVNLSSALVRNIPQAQSGLLNLRGFTFTGNFVAVQPGGTFPTLPFSRSVQVLHEFTNFETIASYRRFDITLPHPRTSVVGTAEMMESVHQFTVNRNDTISIDITSPIMSISNDTSGNTRGESTYAPFPPLKRIRIMAQPADASGVAIPGSSRTMQGGEVAELLIAMPVALLALPTSNLRSTIAAKRTLITSPTPLFADRPASERDAPRFIITIHTEIWPPFPDGGDDSNNRERFSLINGRSFIINQLRVTRPDLLTGGQTTNDTGMTLLFASIPQFYATALDLRHTSINGVVAEGGFSIVATRKIPIYNPVTETFSAPTASRSLVWAFVDVIINSHPLYGKFFSAGLTVDNLALDELVALDTVLTATGNNLDIIFDQDASVGASLVSMASVGRCILVQRGAVIRLIRDTESALPRYIIFPQNIVADEGDYATSSPISMQLLFSSGREINTIAGTIRNRVTLRRTTIMVTQPGETETFRQNINFDGLDSVARAERQARYVLNVLRYRRVVLTFIIEYIGYLLSPYDTVGICNLLLPVTCGYNEVLSYDEPTRTLSLKTTLLLDDIDDTATYYILLQPNNSEITVNENNIVTRLLLETPLPDVNTVVVAEGQTIPTLVTDYDTYRTKCIVGLNEDLYTKCKVLSTATIDEHRIKISCVIDDARVYVGIDA